MSHEHRQHPERFYDDEGEAYPDDEDDRIRAIQAAALRRVLGEPHRAHPVRYCKGIQLPISGYCYRCGVTHRDDA